uniref:Uncharacterized protein n=1 Tax=Siphoviridae sp. ct6d71 TaxID=2826298 RepID=A0A8S5R369_9CAUD|nr:MAG TPA: hypothetical protein [Siphoviridae sp. ct6d71]
MPITLDPDPNHPGLAPSYSSYHFLPIPAHILYILV